MGSGLTRYQKVAGVKLGRAKEMRREATGAEAMLWFLIKGRKVGGYKFRRQQVIRGFIADFYCEELRLCIEVDGGIHANPDQAAYDTARAELFASEGIRVIRLKNQEISPAWNPAY